MLTWNQGLAAVLARTTPGAKRRVRLPAAAGRVLAEPLIARCDSPPFDSSAVDGFGVYVEDVAGACGRFPALLHVVGTIRAGDDLRIRLRPGQAVKLLTGARVPASVGAVVMKEHCQIRRNTILVGRPVVAEENVRRRGAEFRKGQEVLPAGIRITPPVMGLLASFGYSLASVYAEPRVTIAVTGDELLSVGERLRPGKIRDANSYSLAAAVGDLGIAKSRTLRLKDRPAELHRRLGAALRTSDVLLTVGGVSVGDYDFVRSALHGLGVKEIFWRMAVKPGKPAYFGLFGKEAKRSGAARQAATGGPLLVFGLPGNPVSALLCFHQLVKPALLKMMGLSHASTPPLSATLAGEIRNKPGRFTWIRGVMCSRDGHLAVEPTRGQESHMLGGLARANCLIQVPPDVEHLADGQQVFVEPLQWRE